MVQRLSLLVVLLALTAGPASAQDARRVLQDAAAAMGATDLTTIEYAAAGWIAAIGQSFSMNGDDWPRFEVTSYRRVIDYEAGSSREEMTRRQGNYPPRGGGGTPLQGEQQITGLLSGGHAWNLQGDTPVPLTRPYLDGIPFAELRQLEIILTPHGFLKAALAGDPKAASVTIVGPTNTGLTENGRTATIVSFTALGKYRVNGTINDQNMVELVTTWIPNPVYGDMLYEVRHLGYRDFGRVRFPTQIHVHMGDVVFNPAHNYMDVRVTDVQANVSVPAIPVPDVVREATAPPIRVETDELAEGIWRLAGGSHHSVAVEFRDFVAVIEAPLNEARSLAVMAEVSRLAPNKPIRYIVNTHHHFDHSGGLRTYVAHGTTVVTHQGNREFYERVMFHPAPRTLQPDLLATFYPNFTTSRRPVPFETVNQKYVLSDGVRTLDLYPVQGFNHSQNALLAYLPTEKIIVHADMYSPPAPGAAPPAPTPGMVSLDQNIRRLGLDVTQHVPLHGGTGTHDQFLQIVGGGTDSP